MALKPGDKGIIINTNLGNSFLPGGKRIKSGDEIAMFPMPDGGLKVVSTSKMKKGDLVLLYQIPKGINYVVKPKYAEDGYFWFFHKEITDLPRFYSYSVTMPGGWRVVYIWHDPNPVTSTSVYLYDYSLTSPPEKYELTFTEHYTYAKKSDPNTHIEAIGDMLNHRWTDDYGEEFIELANYTGFLVEGGEISSTTYKYIFDDIFAFRDLSFPKNLYVGYTRDTSKGYYNHQWYLIDPDLQKIVGIWEDRGVKELSYGGYPWGFVMNGYFLLSNNNEGRFDRVNPDGYGIEGQVVFTLDGNEYTPIGRDVGNIQPYNWLGGAYGASNTFKNDDLIIDTIRSGLYQSWEFYYINTSSGAMEKKASTKIDSNDLTPEFVDARYGSSSGELEQQFWSETLHEASMIHHYVYYERTTNSNNYDTTYGIFQCDDGVWVSSIQFDVPISIFKASKPCIFAALSFEMCPDKRTTAYGCNNSSCPYSFSVALGPGGIGVEPSHGEGAIFIACGLPGPCPRYGSLSTPLSEDNPYYELAVGGCYGDMGCVLRGEHACNMDMCGCPFFPLQWAPYKNYEALCYDWDIWGWRYGHNIHVVQPILNLKKFATYMPPNKGQLITKLDFYPNFLLQIREDDGIYGLDYESMTEYQFVTHAEFPEMNYVYNPAGNLYSNLRTIRYFFKIIDTHICLVILYLAPSVTIEPEDYTYTFFWNIDYYEDEFWKFENRSTFAGGTGSGKYTNSSQYWCMVYDCQDKTMIAHELIEERKDKGYEMNMQDIV